MFLITLKTIAFRLGSFLIFDQKVNKQVVAIRMSWSAFSKTKWLQGEGKRAPIPDSRENDILFI